jgi:Fe2+ transport system protein B
MYLKHFLKSLITLIVIGIVGVIFIWMSESCDSETGKCDKSKEKSLTQVISGILNKLNN